MASSNPRSAGSTENGAHDAEPSSRATAATEEDERPPAEAAVDSRTRASEAADGASTRRPEPAEAPPATLVGAPTPGPTSSERFAAVAERLHLAPLIIGIALIVFGLLLLGGTQIAWRGLLDAILAVLGLILIVGSRRSGSRRAAAPVLASKAGGR
jgi:hypothetical protein